MIELHPRQAPVLPRHLIPSVLVVVLALVGPSIEPVPECPADTDGPQFLCWLRDQG